MAFTIDLNVNVNVQDSESIRILKLIFKQNTDMAKKIDELLAKQDQIDATLVEIKKDLDWLKAQLSAGSETGLTAEEVQALEARIDHTLELAGGIDSETDSSTPPPTE